MKTPVAMTLIIVGGMLICMPILSDHLQRGQLVRALERDGVTSVSLYPQLSTQYRFGCWFAGGAMVVAAIWASRRSGVGG